MYPKQPEGRRFTIISILLLLALSYANPGFSFPNEKSEAETRTHNLVALNTAYQKASPSRKPHALQALIDATIERQALLSELIESNPGLIIRTAIPERVRKGMPSEIQEFIEHHKRLQGVMEVMYEDHLDGSYRLRHVLKTDKGDVLLHFKSIPINVQTGSRVDYRGVVIGSDMAVDEPGEDSLTLNAGGEASATLTASTAPVLSNTFGEQRTLVMLVNFQDNPADKPWSLNEYEDLVFGTANDYFLEASYGQTWLSGDVVGWYTLPLDSTGCDHHLMGSYANEAATQEGIDISVYSRFIVVFPQNPNCTWSGKGTVGGNPSSTWINGEKTLYLVGHELGHNLGLYHSNNLECGPTPIGDNCAVGTYGDVLDIMGGGASGHYNAYQKDRLGWVGYGASPPITVVESDGSYSLTAYAAADNNPKALKIRKGTDPVTGENTWYYVEYRQATGFDEFLSDYGENVFNGVSVHTGSEVNGNSSLLLDMAPDNAWPGGLDWQEPALVVGESFSDPDAGVSITTVWAGVDNVVVDVSVETPSCSHSNPTLVLNPGESDWVSAGTTVSYTATLTNNDNPACSGSRFDLVVDTPVSWSATLSMSSVVLNPGASDVVVMEITSPSVPDGFYDIGLLATNSDAPNFKSTASATYIVHTEAINQAPTALDDSATTQQGIAVSIDVLANDTDPEGDPLQITSAGAASNGAVNISGNGSISYTPAPSFSGNDSFEYTASDGQGNSDTAHVFVTVTAPSNSPPTAVDDTAATTENTAVSIDVTANDFDPEGAEVNLVAVGQASNGSVTIENSGHVLYVPNRRFKGDDHFTYTISDGQRTASATVSVTVSKKTGGKGGRKPKN